jgi:hypothetical protein
VSWDAATLAYLFLAWTIIGLSDAKSTRAHALAQDTSGFIIFLFVLVAAWRERRRDRLRRRNDQGTRILAESVAPHADGRRADVVVGRDPDRLRFPLREALLQR